jgi:hypothetical protein
MANHRLRGAMLNAEVSAAALAEAVGVDVKSVTRWITEDRIPYPATRVRVSRVLDHQESYLWPALINTPTAAEMAVAELDRIWPTRSAISSETWHALFSRAKRQIDILVYAGAFLIETLDLVDIVQHKAAAGAEVRVLIGDPESAAVRSRAVELSLPWLPERCRSTARCLKPACHQAGVNIRLHGTTHYASHFRFDDVVLVNTHAFGVWSCQSPVLQLQRPGTGGLFDFYAGRSSALGVRPRHLSLSSTLWEVEPPTRGETSEPRKPHFAILPERPG